MRIIQWCEENGIMKLKVMIHERNHASIRFIERMGFSKNDKKESFILYRKEILSVLEGYRSNKISIHALGICSYQAAA